ncbi:hypothetical protein, partial [Candidatus Similichlamydia laticola]
RFEYSGLAHLAKTCHLVSSTVSAISQTCQFDCSFPVTGIMICPEFNEEVDGIFLEWLMIYPGQQLFIDLMNKQVDLHRFFLHLRLHRSR